MQKHGKEKKMAFYKWRLRAKKGIAAALCAATVMTSFTIPVSAEAVTEASAQTEAVSAASAGGMNVSADEVSAAETEAASAERIQEETDVSEDGTAGQRQSGQTADTEAEQTASDGTVVTELASWTTKDDFSGFTYGWTYQYPAGTVTPDPTVISADDAYNGSLKVYADFTGEKDCSWAQLGAEAAPSPMKDISDANKVTFNFYYDSTKLTAGSFKTKVTLQDSTWSKSAENYADIDLSNVENMENGIKKAHASVDLDTSALDGKLAKIAVMIVGVNTTYKGNIWIDDLTVSKSETAADIYVDRTVSPDAANSTLKVTDGRLTDISGNSQAIAASETLADKNADSSVVRTYAYLKALGSSDSVIFGHENDTCDKAGAETLNDQYSDTYDVTGDFPGIIGIDALSLTGSEFSGIVRQKYGSDTTPSGNVAAAAAFTNYNISKGAIIELSAHMPNFANVATQDTTDTEHSYARYVFKGYTPNVTTGDVMNRILPDGDLNSVYNAYLDMIADYASQVKGTILFRPFHENTGSWFWWGAAFCDASTFKSVYRYTVEYLRDVKGVHNIIYVYGPGSEAASESEYGERYPGDAYVDLVGFDMYHSNPVSVNDTWIDSFKNELNIADSFAKKHGKLVAVTETGIANTTVKGDSQTAMLRSENAQKDWYNTVLNAVADSDASYFMLWANFGRTNGFYTPYVVSVSGDKVHGHEMMDNFVSYYNDRRSIFASDQKAAVYNDTYPDIAVTSALANAEGYITAPASKTRILTDTVLSGCVSSNDAALDIKFKAVGSDGSAVTLKAAKGINNQYSAELTMDGETKDILGEGLGSIELCNGDTILDSRPVYFNETAPKEDPYLIDDFEGYYGLNSQLTNAWTSNKASGSTVSFTLTDDSSRAESGYAMKFSYNEKADTDDAGWGGATLSKNVDWSSCNALSFFTVPDGNNQKVVIQVTADGHEYEAYLNKYAGYRDKTTAMKVTIPFSDFKDRDGDGAGLTAEAGKISSVGVWVNSIADTAAVKNGMVSGAIYYDDITAVKTEIAGAEFEDVSTGDSVTVANATYTGKKVTPEVTVKFNGNTLNQGADYTVSYSRNINAGTGIAKITGKSVQFSMSRNFIIKAKDLSSDDIEVNTAASYDYTGKNINIGRTVKYNGRGLKDGKDVTVYMMKDGAAVENAKEKGNYTLVIAAKSSNFTGAKTVNFSVDARTSIKNAAVRIADNKFIFDGTAKLLSSDSISVTLKNRTLHAGTDYTLKCSNNINAGKAVVTITGIGDYRGSITRNYTIGRMVLSSAMIPVQQISTAYDNKGAKPGITVSYNGRLLREGTDYKCTYSGNRRLTDKARISVTGTGNYTGILRNAVTFSITSKSLEDPSISCTTTDCALVPNAKNDYKTKLNVYDGKKKLKSGSDYTISLSGNGKGLSSPTTATVSIIGKGKYSGTKEATFRISRYLISSTRVDIPAVSYNGAAVTLTKDQITVKDRSGKAVASTNYRIVSYSGNLHIGIAKVTLKGKGDYAGYKTVRFVIVKNKMADFFNNIF